MSSKSSSRSSPVAPHIKRKIGEQRRRDLTNLALQQLRELLFKDTDHFVSHENILFEAVFKICGIMLYGLPANIGPMKDRREARKERAKIARAREETAYEHLKTFIRDHRLGTPEQRRKLEKLNVLHIVIDYISKRGNGASRSVTEDPVEDPTAGQSPSPALDLAAIFAQVNAQAPEVVLEPKDDPAPVPVVPTIPETQPLVSQLTLLVFANLLAQQMANAAPVVRD